MKTSNIMIVNLYLDSCLFKSHQETGINRRASRSCRQTGGAKGAAISCSSILTQNFSICTHSRSWDVADRGTHSSWNSNIWCLKGDIHEKYTFWLASVCIGTSMGASSITDYLAITTGDRSWCVTKWKLLKLGWTHWTLNKLLKMNYNIINFANK